VIGVCIIIGLVLTAVYILRVFGQAFFGPPNPRWEGLRGQDMAGLQLLPRAILVAVLIFFGFFPQAMLSMINSTTLAMLERF
tara:strand:+ start:299 stop:544 length:246 start_codon:yes stop_codon:yes gene_type:complete